MQNFNELANRYPGQWVVASKDGLEGHGEDLESVFDVIAKSKPGEKLENFAVLYFRTGL